VTGVARVRRPPPPFRVVTVAGTAPIGPRLTRVTLTGPGLVGFPAAEPGASVRLLLPSPGDPGLVLPDWTGNEFLRPDGSRPVLRTFTPLAGDAERGTLDLAVVRHGHGAASAWVDAATAGAPCAVSGPGRGHAVDPDARGYVLAGDESALPAIGQLLEVVPASIPVRVHVEVAAPEGRIALPAHPRATVTWHDLDDPTDPGSRLVAAIAALDLADDERVWVAGEAASVQRIRVHLFTERGFPRARATVRGYWKRGRAGDGDDD